MAVIKKSMEPLKNINALEAARIEGAPYHLAYYAQYYSEWLKKYSLWEFEKIFEMYKTKITTLSELPNEADKIFKKV